MNSPIKRHESLKPLSRDHHHGLLLCWKIKEGLKKQISEDRIKAYNDFFFTSQLRPHFNFEEQEVFPLLGESHPLIIKAISEHRRLEELFKAEADKEVFLLIETELNNHIRFEERELFMEIQKTIPENELQQIANKEEKIITPNPDNWEDKFWLKA